MPKKSAKNNKKKSVRRSRKTKDKKDKKEITKDKKEITKDKDFIKWYISCLNKQLNNKEINQPLKSLKSTAFINWWQHILTTTPNLLWINTPYLALIFYKTDAGYILINNTLRGRELDKYFIDIYKNTISCFNMDKIRIINLIDKGLNDKQKGMQVFRGIRKEQNKGFNIDNNTSYKELGYSSTSTDFCVSRKFIGECCILSFEIPSNLLSVDYKDITRSFLDDEKEILLERNIIYYIGNSMTINSVVFYPCVLTKIGEELDQNSLLFRMKKQEDYLNYFKDIEFLKSKSGTPEEILTILENNSPYKHGNFIFNFDVNYSSLCLDEKMKPLVYELALKKYPKI